MSTVHFVPGDIVSCKIAGACISQRRGAINYDNHTVLSCKVDMIGIVIGAEYATNMIGTYVRIVTAHGMGWINVDFIRLVTQ